MRSPPTSKIKFWGVVRGGCWLSVHGEPTPTRFEEGDILLLSEPRELVAKSDLAANPVDLSVVQRGRQGAISRLGEGDDFFMIGGKMEFGGDGDKLFFNELPGLIHIHSTSKQADILQLLLMQLVREKEEALPGAGIASAQLVHLIFIQILRAFMESAGPMKAGWLRAVSDRRLAPAVRLMHHEPGRAWQLGELAKAAAMSRATFASYFKHVAGRAPITYLTEWRMHLAKRELVESETAVGFLAQSLGYASESAFSNAFKRVVGKSPKGFRDDAKVRRSLSGFHLAKD